MRVIGWFSLAAAIACSSQTEHPDNGGGASGGQASGGTASGGTSNGGAGGSVGGGSGGTSSGATGGAPSGGVAGAGATGGGATGGSGAMGGSATGGSGAMGGGATGGSGAMGGSATGGSGATGGSATGGGGTSGTGGSGACSACFQSLSQNCAAYGACDASCKNDVDPYISCICGGNNGCIWPKSQAGFQVALCLLATSGSASACFPTACSKLYQACGSGCCQGLGCHPSSAKCCVPLGGACTDVGDCCTTQCVGGTCS
ncbi:MAG: hypothetical protein U0263_16780 [Polyangiaceae bacterium]